MPSQQQVVLFLAGAVRRHRRDFAAIDVGAAVGAVQARRGHLDHGVWQSPGCVGLSHKQGGDRQFFFSFVNFEFILLPASFVPPLPTLSPF